MNLWIDSDELDLVYENKQVDGMIAYHLYEANYLEGLRFIFRRALENRDKCVLKKYLKKSCTYEENKSNCEKTARINKLRSKESNIISFIGSRGAGKTTAVTEFCEILKTLNNDCEKSKWIDKVIENDEEKARLSDLHFNFEVLPAIDAALLSDSEDLMELVLINLFNQFECKNKNSTVELNKAYELFQELFGIYRTKGGKVDDELISSYANKLNSSLMISDKLEELLGIMSESKCRDDYGHFYVITIDDIDLNIKHGYEMIEQLQRYLCQYRIIILITMDYEQLMYICEEHFHNALKNVDEEKKNIHEVSHSKMLSNDIMTKLFPLQQRLFLPDLKRKGRKISLSFENISDSGKVSYSNISMKKFIMKKLAERMCIFYDINGEKRHFCEPDTIRQLVNYNDFLNMLISVDFSKLEQVIERKSDNKNTDDECKDINEILLKDYNRNHARINDDIVNRQAQLTLYSNQQAVFKKLLEFNLERRAVYLKHMDKNLGFSSIGQMDLNDYAYADFLERVFLLSRENFDNKPLVSCILASFTSEMVMEYMSYTYQPIGDMYNKAKQRLSKFLGKSFSNNWLWEYNRAKVDKSLPLLYMDDVQLGQLSAWFDVSALKKYNSGYAKIKKWILETGIIQYLEYMDMFLIKENDEDYLGPNIHFELAEIKNKDLPVAFFDINEIPDIPAKGAQNGKKYFRITYTTQDKCMFDVMGFVPKSFGYTNTKKYIHDQIKRGLTDIICNLCTKKTKEDISDDVCRAVDEAAKEVSVFDKKNYINELSYQIAFPYFQVDMSYNIMKRVRRSIDKYYKEESAYKTILAIYDDIEYNLGKEMEGYRTEDDQTENDMCDFKQIFNLCPYIIGFRALGTSNPTVVNNIIESIKKMRLPVEVILEPKEPEGE